jgi:2-C-methyl-D-erythritol 4-phosphate cytidylyltransferase
MTEQFAAILPAAGRSARFGGGRDKLLEPVGGRSVIARSVGAFLARADVGCVVLPTNQRDRIEPVLQDLGAGAVDPRVVFCAGGASRAASVLAALRAVPARFEWVAVHDAARPLISQALIDTTLTAARRHGAAAPALPVALTIRQADGPLPARAGQTLPRHTLWAMQTPQIARRLDLLAAYESCPLALQEVTDDLQLLELAGRDVWLVAGEERNLKVTTTTDAQLAEVLLRAGEPT